MKRRPKRSKKKDLSRLKREIAALKKELTASRKLTKIISRGKYQWETTFDAIADPVAIITKKFKIVRVNRAYARLIGKDIKKLAENSDVIINTTSVGMSPNENHSILDEKDLAKGRIVMDLVYKPVNTKLIRSARGKGCRTITGDRMLIYQAVRQFELWTGIYPGFESMERELAN